VQKIEKVCLFYHINRTVFSLDKLKLISNLLSVFVPQMTPQISTFVDHLSRFFYNYKFLKLKMLKNILLLCFIVFEVNGFEPDFLINMAKSCFPNENFGGYFLLVDEFYTSDEEIQSMLRFSEKELFTRIVLR
jgi:hypothetical protein